MPTGLNSVLDYFHLTSYQWLLAIISAISIGLGKSGFGGVGMLSVALMATVMRGHERESTGIILPLLVCGDLFAVRAFRGHVRWRLVGRMLPPALFGVGLGYFWMSHLSDLAFKPVVGWAVLVLVALQAFRQFRADAFQGVPHTAWFAWTAGISAGIVTMLANAAGPVMTIYFLAIGLPKLEFVATAAWFFLVVNLCKIPLSTHLGLIHPGSLVFNAIQVPFVGLGILMGRSVMHRIDQRAFEYLLLILTAGTALHLIFL